jgi:dTDP-4-amino-4,6-dideoxygalactose transaminase
MTVLCPEGCWNAEFVSKLLAKGVDSRTYFSPACHQQRCFTPAPRNEMTVTEGVSKRVLSLPLWEEMTQDEINRVVQGLLSK